jgi:outer membrane receptor protein involved in Fe transport
MGLSLLDANGVVEGRLPRGRGSWLLAGRRTYYDIVAEPLVRSSLPPHERAGSHFDLPAFQDIQTKLVLDLPHGHALSAFALAGREGTDALNDRALDDYTKIRERVRSRVVALTHQFAPSARLAMRTALSTYRDDTSFSIDAKYDDGPARRVEVAFAQEHSVSDWAIRHESTAQVSQRHTLAAGFEAHRLDTRLAWTIEGARATAHGIGSLYRLQNWELPGTGLPAKLDSSHVALRSALWLQDRVQVARALTFDLGLRLDHADINRESTLSPRASSVWTLSRRLRVRAAAGLYAQSPGQEKTPQADYALVFDGARPLSLRSQHARHMLLGAEMDLDAATMARIEIYDKRFDHMWTGTLETDADRAARVANYDFPAELRDSVPSRPMVTTRPDNTARGRARGFDVFVERRPSSARRPHGWVSYSYGVATREAYGRTFPADYDLRHAVNAVYGHRVTPWMSLSLTGRYASGFPYTPVAGVRVAAVRDVDDADGDGNRDELIPERYLGQLVYEAWMGGPEQINRARHEHFSRIDLRTTFHIKRRASVYLDVINVLNRRNPGSVERTTSGPSIRENEHQFSLPIIPSLGVHVLF